MTYTVRNLRLASCTRRSRERSHVPDDHPLALRRASPPYDMLQRALARHCPTTAARVPLLPPPKESTFVTCCPRPLHGMKWEPPGEPSWRERDDGLLKSGMGRTARTARASRRRAGAAAGARHGRLRASQAPSRVPRNSYRPWGHLGPLGRGVAAYGGRDTVKMNYPVRTTHGASLPDSI